MTLAEHPVQNVTDGAGKASGISSVAGLASLRAGARLQGTLHPRFTPGESPTEQPPNEE